jgi:hypothetical protein
VRTCGPSRLLALLHEFQRTLDCCA